MRGVGALEHLVLLRRELVPAILCLNVDLRQFPLPQRIGLAPFEPACLLFLGHREVELHQDRALPHDVLLEPWAADHEIFVLVIAAETEDALDHGAVVPAAVEQHHLASTRHLTNIFLEEPLRLLFLGRFA